MKLFSKCNLCALGTTSVVLFFVFYVMTQKQQRYIKNREEIIRKTRERIAAQEKDPRYAELFKLRKKISAINGYVLEHRRKIARLKNRQRKYVRRKEILEIELGRERAVRKGKVPPL